MTLYFEDREKLDGFVLEIPAERTIHFHTNELKIRTGRRSRAALATRQ